MTKDIQADGYEKLAAAIAVQAIDDFRKALRHLVRGKGNLDADVREIDEVIRFVKSGWFKTLTTVEPEIVLNQLELEVGKSGIKRILGEGRYDEFLKKTFSNNKEN